MATVLGTHVPDLGSNPSCEICHSFVYRWLIARGKITGNYPDPLRELMQDAAKQILFQERGGPARSNGVINVRSGQVISFWEQDNLQHSLVALTASSWYGANNTGCFGVPGGRTQVDNIDQMISNGSPASFGWVGNGNQWRSMGGVLSVFALDLPDRNI